MNENTLSTLSTIADDYSELHAAALYMARGNMGGFAGYIGDAMLVADPNNLERLRRAFPDLIQRAWDHISLNS
jgi:hypothetical protein